MIVHTFRLTSFHLNKSLIRAFNEISTNNSAIVPYFLIYGTYIETEVKKHLDLFDQLGITNYYFSHSIKELYQFAKENKNLSFLLHGMTYACMCTLIISGVKLNWVCWGAGASVNWRNWKSILFTPFKILIYHRFHTIITLMAGDKITLEHDFLLKGVKVLPYFAYNAVHFKDKFIKLNRNKDHKSKLAVLLGNSAHCIDTYYELLDKLSRFKGLITVNCMMQYPRIDNRILLDLKEKGEALFGRDSFFLDTEMLETEAYFAYMAKFDIYICGTLEQSGLGAANTCIILGKKVYLTGKNLDWMRSCGLFVCDVKSIENSSDCDFLELLTERQKNFNFNKRYTSVEEIKEKWIRYLQIIAKE